ncbi:helix-turn-helix transcriptional regulator [Streptomyces sp. NPDC058108]|uniref:helix-turn-helix transcriptional regulator n=1 Tax=Streptomyces sp. NPDC058108 TaxID=3346344 RepID=UPI0036E3749C
MSVEDVEVIVSVCHDEYMAASSAEKIRSRLRVRKDLPNPDQRRALREAAGLSQQELGDAIGVTRQTVSHWEAGRYSPRGPLLDRAVEAYGILREASGLTTELA